MDLFEELRGLGVNIDEGLNRLGGNEALYKRLLGTFTKSIKSYSLNPDFGSDEYVEITEKAHAIKGVSVNLSITPIYEAYSQIVSLMRCDQPDKAKDVLKNVLPVQDKIVNCIEKYM